MADAPDGLPEISTDALQFCEAPHVASLLAQLELVSKTNVRLTRRLLGVKAAPPIRGGAELHMQAHLVVKILYAPPARDEEPDASKQHHAICNTRAIAPVTR